MHTLRNRIIDNLKKYPKTRDDVFYLVKLLHDEQMKQMKIPKSKYYDYFHGERLYSIKTIDRIWRNVQEKHKELRGKKWAYRQYQAGIIAMKYATENLKQQLTLFNEMPTKVK